MLPKNMNSFLTFREVRFRSSVRVQRRLTYWSEEARWSPYVVYDKASKIQKEIPMGMNRLPPFSIHSRSCARIHQMFDSNSIVCTICEINWSENVPITERPECMRSSYIGHSFSAWCSTHEPAPGPRRIGLRHRRNHQKRGCAGSTASWYCSCS
jgi:hypothetical protein